MTRVASIGECMIELRQATGGQPGGLYSRSYGGDTLNTAVYLSRLGVHIDYITALGDDGLSDEMIAGWAAEGIGTKHVARLAGKLPGLYLIESGTVRISDAAGDSVSELGSRNSFGERGLLRDGMAATTATAVEDVAVLVLPRAELTRMALAGQVRNGPLLSLALWLELNQQKIRMELGQDKPGLIP